MALDAGHKRYRPNCFASVCVHKQTPPSERRRGDGDRFDYDSCAAAAAATASRARLGFHQIKLLRSRPSDHAAATGGGGGARVTVAVVLLSWKQN